jgi:hypothetical protein
MPFSRKQSFGPVDIQHVFMQKETTYIDTMRINIFNPLKPKYTKP